MAPTISFSGIASGIDSTSLIQALLDRSRATRIAPLESRIESLGDENDAFGTLSALLNKLKDHVQNFRTLNGGILSKFAVSSDETVASASASNGAPIGSTTVNVLQIAKNGTFSFDDNFSSLGSPVAPGLVDTGNNSITIDVGTGSDQESVNLNVTSATTLDDLVSQFNNSSSKAVASIVNKGTSSSPQYAFVVNSLKEGSAQGEIAVSVGSDITSAGIFNSSTLSQAQDAQFTISGINGTVTRASNTISDVFDGLTFTFSKPGSTTFTVASDVDATTETLQGFVDIYNEIVDFVKENDLVTRTENGDQVENIFGPLSSSSLDEQILSTLRNAISSSGNSSGTSAKIFADLGITTNQDGTLEFDSDVFAKALSSDPDSVAKIAANLGETLGAVDGSIAQYTRFNGLIDGLTNSNSSTISDLNKRVADLEKILSREEQNLTNQFARLESLVGNLQSQQSALSSILPS